MKRLVGIVIKKSGVDTVKVDTKRTIQHPLYRKSLTISKRFLVHSHNQDLSVGDTVTIEPCRTISKNKHYRIYDTTLVKGNKI